MCSSMGARPTLLLLDYASSMKCATDDLSVKTIQLLHIKWHTILVSDTLIYRNHVCHPTMCRYYDTVEYTDNSSGFEHQLSCFCKWV